MKGAISVDMAMRIRITKRTKYYIILALYLLLDLNFLYLLNSNTFNFFGITYTDFVFLMNIGFVFAVLLVNRFQIRQGAVLSVVLWCVLLACLSAYAGTKAYDQPFLLGLVSQREWVSCILLIYPISSWMKKGKVTLEGVKKLLYALSAAYLVVCIVQYMLYGVFVFTYTPIPPNARYGETRIYFETLNLTLISGFALDSLLGDKSRKALRKSIRYVVFLFGVFFVTAIITKGRMNTIAWVGAVMICMVVRSENNILRKLILCFIGIVVAVAFLSSEMGLDIYNTLIGASSANDTLGVRYAGSLYYWSLILKSGFSAIFGCGSPNIHWSTAQDITNPLWQAGGTAQFYTSDQGITGVALIYGLLGLTLFAILMIYCLRISIRINKATGNTAYLFFWLVEIIGCLTIVPSVFKTSIVFPFYFVMLSSEKDRLALRSQY